MVIAWLKLLLLALHVKFFKLSFLVGVNVYDKKAGPPTPTTVLLYLQIMVSLGIPLLTEQFIVIECPAVACIMPSSVSFWTAMFVGLSELNTKSKLLYFLSHRRKSATRKHVYVVTVFFFSLFFKTTCM